jgi:hypothetical protein
MAKKEDIVAPNGVPPKSDVGGKEDSGERKLDLTNPKILAVFFASIVILAGVIFGGIYLSNLGSVELLSQCSDDTFYSTCSLDKPFYCAEGVFVENSSYCGCPEFMNKNNGGCSSIYEKNSFSVDLNYVLEGELGTINYEVYKGVSDHLSQIQKSIFYSGLEQASRADFKLMNINEEVQREYLLPLFIEIENRAETREDALRIAVSLVQNIPFGQSERIVNFGGGQTNYSRYGYEVLYDFQGICGEKSELMSFLLREMGYGLAVFYFPFENHEALGIKCPIQYSFENTGYCFVESSGPSIISDGELDYVGVGKLSRENYKVFLLSEGDSLSVNMYEYADARTLQRVRGQESNNKYVSLKEKYGLQAEYISSA